MDDTASELVRDPLMTPGQVARVFNVDPKTVSRWADKGLIEWCLTPGGHRRFPQSAVMKFLPEAAQPETEVGAPALSTRSARSRLPWAIR